MSFSIEWKMHCNLSLSLYESESGEPDQYRGNQDAPDDGRAKLHQYSLWQITFFKVPQKTQRLLNFNLFTDQKCFFLPLMC